MKKFTIITDYKNFKYFINLRKLNKRQVRQLIYMNQYNMKIVYQSGKDNQRIDTLSRREQDILSKKDKRIQKREFQILKLNYLKDDEEGEIEQIIIIEIDLIVIINKRIIKY